MARLGGPGVQEFRDLRDEIQELHDELRHIHGTVTDAADRASRAPATLPPRVRMARTAVRFSRLLVAVSVLATLAFFSLPAVEQFVTPPSTKPASVPDTFSVDMRAKPGQSDSSLAVRRTGTWQGALTFQVEFDDRNPSWRWNDPPSASQVVVAAPKSLLDWACAPMTRWVEDSTGSVRSGPDWSLGVTLGEGNPPTRLDLDQITQDGGYIKRPLTSAIHWSKDDVQNMSGGAHPPSAPAKQLVGLECVALKKGAAPLRASTPDEQVGWWRDNVARISPPLDKASQRRVTIPGVNATTNGRLSTRNYVHFGFPISWSLVNGDTGGLDVGPTAIRDCAIGADCDIIFPGSAYSWVFEDQIAKKSSDVTIAGSSLILSVLVSLVLAGVFQGLKFVESRLMRPVLQ